jgi:hypothetical protein
MRRQHVGGCRARGLGNSDRLVRVETRIRLSTRVGLEFVGEPHDRGAAHRNRPGLHSGPVVIRDEDLTIRFHTSIVAPRPAEHVSKSHLDANVRLTYVARWAGCPWAWPRLPVRHGTTVLPTMPRKLWRMASRLNFFAQAARRREAGLRQVCVDCASS